MNKRIWKPGGLLSTLVLMAALLGLPVSVAQAEESAHPTPATALVATSVPSSSYDDGTVSDVWTAATDSANRAVANACLPGRQIAAPHWVRLTLSTPRTIRASARASEYFGRTRFDMSGGVALVSRVDSTVLACATGKGTSALRPRKVGSEGIFVVAFHEAQQEPLDDPDREFYGGYERLLTLDIDTLAGAPTSVAVTKSDAARTGTVTWSPPTSDGGSAITGYRVSRDGRDASDVGPWSTTVAASARSFTFTNLAAGSTYRLSVQAVNAVGAGPAASRSVSIGGRTVAVTAVADTMARQQAPSTASGSVASLLSDTQQTTGTASRVTSYLRFTVPALAAGERIAVSRLRLQVSNGTSNGPAVWRTGTGWTESTLRWNSGQPARSGTAAVGNFASMGTGRVSTGVSGVTASGAVSFQLYAEASNGLAFVSRESTTGSSRPQLVLTITRP